MSAGLEVRIRAFRLFHLTADVTVIPLGVSLRFQSGITRTLARVRIGAEKSFVI